MTRDTLIVRNYALQVALRKRERSYAEVAARVAELEDAALLVLRQFADIRDDKWATLGMKTAIENLDEVTNGPKKD